MISLMLVIHCDFADLHLLLYFNVIYTDKKREQWQNRINAKMEESVIVNFQNNLNSKLIN